VSKAQLLIQKINEFTISAEATTALEGANKDKEVTALRKKVTMYKKQDKGLALARTAAVNMISSANMEMAKAFDKGKQVDVEKMLAKKQYKKVTEPLLGLVQDYIKAVAAKL